MARKKKENIEEFEQYISNGLTEEDKVISLEGITKVEKVFLNVVRNFYGQSWLLEQISEHFQELMENMVSKTVEDIALRGILEEFHTKHIALEDIHPYYLDKIEEVQAKEELMNDIIQHWADTIQDTLEGELPPTEE